MMKLFPFRAMGFFGGLAAAASAQTLFVPSGMSGIGSSSTTNVGVGTSSPAASLDVGATTAGGALRTVFARQGEGNGTGSGTFLGVRAWATQNAQYNGKMFSIENTFYGYLNSSIEFYRGGGATGGFMTFATGSGAERMRIDGEGNVGIGTANPDKKLVVAGTEIKIDAEGQGGGRLQVYDAGNLGYRIRSGNGGGWRWQFVDGGNGEYFGVSYPEGTVYVKGSLGVQTSTPSTPFEVCVVDNDRLGVYGPANNAVAIQTLLDGRTPIQYPYGGSENRLLLQPLDGNVGIGTTNPTHKLTVNGTIRAKEVIVDTGWADYVFTEDYRLAPLSEVEAHIKEHKHLPDMPSAAEVAEKGVSMGEMQAKLLAKVEELTLHVIAQEKRAVAQEQRIQSQRDEIAMLRQELARAEKE